MSCSVRPGAGLPLSELCPLRVQVSSTSYPAGLSSAVGPAPGPRPPALMGSETRNLTTPEMPAVNHHLLTPAPAAQVRYC